MSMRMDGSYLYHARRMKPALLWAQVDDVELCKLAAVLVRVDGNPAGAVGGERNHKTSNRVRSKLRVRLGQGTCEKQVAVAYNSSQLKRVLTKKRTDSYTAVLAGTGSVHLPGELQLNVDQASDDSDEDVTEDELALADDPKNTLNRYISESELGGLIVQDGIVR